MQAKPQTFFRVMCGRKAHSSWVTPESMALKIAVDNGLASTNHGGRIYFGPLVWIEVGIRARPKVRTIPDHNSEKLPLRDRPVWQSGEASS